MGMKIKRYRTRYDVWYLIGEDVAYSINIHLASDKLLKELYLIDGLAINSHIDDLNKRFVCSIGIEFDVIYWPPINMSFYSHTRELCAEDYRKYKLKRKMKDIFNEE